MMGGATSCIFHFCRRPHQHTVNTRQQEVQYVKSVIKLSCVIMNFVSHAVAFK